MPKFGKRKSKKSLKSTLSMEAMASLQIEKNRGGRPPKFDTELDFVKVVITYFEECIQTRWIPSKAGLLRALNMSRPTWMEYKKKFPNTVRKAENMIEEAWVQRLTSQGATGAIFYLKNAFRDDYQDKVETDLTTKGEKLVALGVIQSNIRNILEGREDKPAKK